MAKCTLKQCHFYDRLSGNRCSCHDRIADCKTPLIKNPKEIVLSKNQQTIYKFFKALSDVELLASDIDERITRDDMKIALFKFNKVITETDIDDIVSDGRAHTQIAIAILDRLMESEGE